MGWASAGAIFDGVAHSLIEAGVNDQVLDSVLYPLAKSLSDDDWDTEDESVDEFTGHPVVQHAVRKAQGYLTLYPPDDRIQGYLEFSPAAPVRGSASESWELAVWELTILSETFTEPDTVEGFNALVDRWATAGGTGDYMKAAADYRLR